MTHTSIDTTKEANGRLCGQQASKATGQANRIRYEQSPAHCNQCGHVLAYKKRHNKFCSRSCSASFNNNGRIVSESTKAKLSVLATQNNPAKTITLVCAACGKQFTRRHIHRHVRSCSPACKAKLISDKMKQYALTHPELTFNRNPYKQSFLERSFERWLISNGLRKNRFGYLTEVWFRNKKTNKLHRADFVFPLRKLVVELDGSQHELTTELDAVRDECLISRGWTVVRITHKEYLKKTKLKLVCDLLGVDFDAQVM